MRVLLVLATAMGVAGCVTEAGTFGVGSAQVAAGPTTIPLQTSWTMPWQLDPESALSRAQGEQIYTAYIPELGQVRGTRAAISYARAPLNAPAGRNRALEPCRNLIAKEAEKFGAVRVEATSLGPDRRDRSGSVEGPVGIRIFYPATGGVQVRQAALTCKVDARGKVLDAFVPSGSDERFAALREP
ncbi:MAG: hypothetical protein ABW026_10080 [Microvirga sp.]